MNPFEHINDMRKHFETKKAEDTLSQRITLEEHYDSFLQFLDVLELAMQDAEYNYEVQTVDQEIHTLKEMHVLQKHLSDDVLIFQPIAIGEAELSAVDIQSMADVLKQMRDSGKIKEDILIVPPNVNIFRAKLVQKSWDEQEMDYGVEIQEKLTGQQAKYLNDDDLPFN